MLVWKDKGFSSSKWNWFYISKDYFSKWVGKDSDRYKSSEIQRLCNKSIDLSLLDQSSGVVALGHQNIDIDPIHDNNKTCVLGSGIAGISILYADNYKNSIRTSPYFGRMRYGDGEILPMQIFTISVKILREDIPRVKNIKMEVKPIGGT